MVGSSLILTNCGSSEIEGCNKQLRRRWLHFRSCISLLPLYQKLALLLAAKGVMDHLLEICFTYYLIKKGL